MMVVSNVFLRIRGLIQSKVRREDRLYLHKCKKMESGKFFLLFSVAHKVDFAHYIHLPKSFESIEHKASCREPNVIEVISCFCLCCRQKTTSYWLSKATIYLYLPSILLFNLFSPQYGLLMAIFPFPIIKYKNTYKPGAKSRGNQAHQTFNFSIIRSRPFELPSNKFQ